MPAQARDVGGEAAGDEFLSPVKGPSLPQIAVAVRRRSGEKKAISPNIWPGPRLALISTKSIRPSIRM